MTKQIKIGIIGVENKHASELARRVNVEKKFSGCCVTSVWGEKLSLSREFTEKFGIKQLCRKESEMWDGVDAVFVNQRHPKYHLASARPFVERSIPTFIDKPFAFDVAETKAFLKLAKRQGTPVDTSSPLHHTTCFAEFKKRLGKLGEVYSVYMTGPADYRMTRYGGIFFYGVHHVESVLMAFGHEIREVRVTKNGDHAVAQLVYPQGLTVNINFAKEKYHFFLEAFGDLGSASTDFSKGDVYDSFVSSAIRLFKTGKAAQSHAEILRTVEVLDAIRTGLHSDKKVKLPAYRRSA